MDNIEYIENYFKSAGSNDLQKQQFEKRITEDASFAEEVAFYVSAKGLIKQQLLDEKKLRFREMYQQQKVVSIKPPVKNIWRHMAAASVIFAVIFLSWFLLGKQTSPQQLADKYIQQNLQTLGLTMGTQDSMQTGLNYFKTGKLTKALVQFETIMQADPANDEAIKDAGIVSLKLKDYDKALNYFTLLQADTSLYSNPGKFYKAITLLKRNKNGDKAAAKSLLQEVIAKDLEGRKEAEEWIKDF